jgi:hypothetical protein
MLAASGHKGVVSMTGSIAEDVNGGHLKDAAVQAGVVPNFFVSPPPFIHYFL